MTLSINTNRPQTLPQDAPSGVLRQGARGANVTELQNALNALGFNAGAADGQFGAKTGDALRAFQRANGLPADGVYGPQTKAALDRAIDARGNAAPTPAPANNGGATAPRANLQEGSRGSAVTQLQNALRQVGHDAGPADGKFGAKTDEALRDFQHQWGLPNDGVYGPNTRQALDRALSGQRPPANTGTGGTGGTTGVTPPVTGTGAGARALASAQSQVGVREATGNNDGTPATRYSGGRQEPWCANFVAWNFRQAGNPLPGNQRMLASVQYMEDQMKRTGAFIPRGTQQPRPGDIIFFSNRGGSDAGGGRHVGIVERVENGRVYTVEGNSGNAVRRRDYPLDLARISGYGRP